MYFLHDKHIYTARKKKYYHRAVNKKKRADIPIVLNLN